MKCLLKIIAGFITIACITTALTACNHDNSNTVPVNQNPNTNSTVNTPAPSQNSPVAPEPSQNTSPVPNQNNNTNPDYNSDSDAGSYNPNQNQQTYSQDFTLINMTGVEIYQLYISPSDQNLWGSDILEGSTLPNQNRLNIHFSPQETSQYWDLIVLDQNGNSITWRYIDLFRIAQVTLYFDGSTPTAIYD